jgi:hypothetical protein
MARLLERLVRAARGAALCQPFAFSVGAMTDDLSASSCR